MDTLEFILALFGMVLLSSVISQLVPRVSSPLIQIALGFILAIMPQSGTIVFDPDIILLLFIAPLLFQDARKANKYTMWKSRSSIISLAIGLVIITMLIVGFALNLLVPSIPLAAAFALGAALGPTDAVAVMSLSKQTKLTDRQSALLSGEALINDASGVVSFQFAVAAAVTGAFSMMDAVKTFCIDFFGGILLGIVLMYLIILLVRFLRKMGLDSITFHVLFEVMLPFLVYLVAEEIHVSGILAVVSAGILLSFMSEEMTPDSAKQSIVSTNVWNVIAFSLNGFVFILLGAQMPHIFVELLGNSAVSNSHILLLCLFIAFVVVAVRFVWCVFMLSRADRSDETQNRTWRERLKSSSVLSFAGAKGAVTLAVIYSLPQTLNDGSFFPERDLLILIASGVILITLLLANFLVPVFAPVASDTNKIKQSDAEAMATIWRSVVARLQDGVTKENRLASEDVIESYNKRIDALKDRADFNDEDESYNDLKKRALLIERAYVEHEIAEATVPANIGYTVLSKQNGRLTLVEHKDESFTAFRSFLTSAKMARTHYANKAKMRAHGTKEERTQLVRTLELEACESACEELVRLLADDEVIAEDATRLLMEYRKRIDRLRDDQVSVTRLTKVDTIRGEIEARALRYESEEIQTMLDENRISRARAKRMLDNVSLMELDRIDKFE